MAKRRPHRRVRLRSATAGIALVGVVACAPGQGSVTAPPGGDRALDPAHPAPPPGVADPEPRGAPVAGPTTLAEAQAAYDPENDPLVLVDEAEDGTYRSITLAVLEHVYVPPATVLTADQYARWLDELPGGRRRTSS